MRHHRFVLIVLALALVTIGHADPCATHTYLGNNPDEANPGWHEEVQGLAHDADHWYITQNPPFFINFPDTTIRGGPRIWRVPVTTNLATDVDCGEDGVSCSELRHTPLFGNDYNHYGDPDIVEFGGRAYLLVPIENGDPGDGLAIFRADATLEFLAFAPFPVTQRSGWVAVDANRVLVASDDDGFTQFNRYFVDWAAFQATGEQTLVMESLAPMLLRDENGLPMEMGGAQGGEFSDDHPEQLYYSAGGFGDFEPTWGVHLFDTSPGTPAECGAAGSGCVIARRIDRSNNSPGGFAYEFNTSNFEEPEGLTFWDLDADGRAPGLRGQLHVVLLDNDVLTADDAYVKHYRRSLEDATPPDLACPGDTTVECSMPSGIFANDPTLAAFFAGASATDQCDSTPLVTSDAPAVFGFGPTPVTFTATDLSQNASSCVARVTVVDTTPPAVSCPAPVIVECTGAGGINANDPQLAAFFAGGSAIDACDLNPAVTTDAPATLPLGQTSVTFAAQDSAGNAGACTSSIRVADTVAPRISVSLSHTTLWPPNHRLVPITATVTALDRCDPTVTIQLVSITDSQSGGGPGPRPAEADIQGASFGTADFSFALRAERAGSDRAGRVYTIVYRAADGSGNTSTATAQVVVPHDRR